MSSVVDLRVPVLLPSANYEMARRHLPAWVGHGYRVIVLQDRLRFDMPGCEVVHADEYHGYAWAVNKLYREHPGVSSAPVVVLIGDDMDPDPTRSPGQIRDEFCDRFPDGFGVMQPIGDALPGVDRICGSPWVGRSFASRINGGRGILREEYYHFFADEELHGVASMLGVLWQRKDLSHYHDHWTRRGARPTHLGKAQERWDEDKAKHDKRRDAGYPGHEPLAFGAAARPSLRDVAAALVASCDGRVPADSSDSVQVEAVWIHRLREALS